MGGTSFEQGQCDRPAPLIEELVEWIAFKSMDNSFAKLVGRSG